MLFKKQITALMKAIKKQRDDFISLLEELQNELSIAFSNLYEQFIASLKIGWASAIYFTTHMKAVFLIASYVFLWGSIVGLTVFSANEAFLYFSAHNPENIELFDFLEAGLHEVDRLPHTDDLPTIRPEVIRELNKTGTKWCSILSWALFIRYLMQFL